MSQVEEDVSFEQPHVLVGIEHKMSPIQARYYMLSGAIKRMSSEQIRSDMKMIATTIHHHQKLAPRLPSSVDDRGISSLAYFVSAAHGKEPPTTAEAFSLFDHCNATPCRLGRWANLYYALLAEIRTIYADITLHFETEFRKGALVLHTCGRDANATEEPFTVLSLASILEEMWLVLMDARLVGPLDTAVRIEQFSEKFREEFGEEHFGKMFAHKWDHAMSDGEKAQAIEAATGMVDTHQMSPSEIMDMLSRQPLTPEWRNRRGNRSDDTRLGPEADDHRIHTLIQDASANRMTDVLCTCATDCKCRLVCQFEVSPCACRQNHKISHAPLSTQEDRQNRAELDTGSLGTRPLVSAATDHMAQLNIETMGRMVKGSRTSELAYQSNTRDDQQRQPRRRSNTNQSELAYVPCPKTPARGRKDAYPLDFYGGSSPGGRYPQFAAQCATANSSRPIYGESCYSTNVPSRKPVPDRLSTATSTRATSPDATLPSTPHRQMQVSPDTSPLGGVFYPKIPKSTTTKNPFTQSFPVVAAGNPREPENEFADWNSADLVQSAMPTMSTQFCSQPSEPSKGALGRHSADSPRPRRKEVKPEIKSFDSGLPRVDESVPDFISPRPALTQRYFSAGGTARLQDRQELQGFELPASLNTGVSIHREELMRMAEQQNILRRDSAVVLSRKSQDKSQRSSREIDELIRGGKRGRTDSTSSFRKLKRVFSRQNSQSE